MELSFGGFDCSHYKISKEDLLLYEAVLLLGVSNPKTLNAQPVIKAGETELVISSIKYDSISPFATTVCFNMPEIVLGEKLFLTGQLKFQGGEDIKIQPVAGDNEIKMSSSWATPSFSGGWLPSQRAVSSEGFSAVWNIAGLSTAFPKSWKAESEIKGESVLVSFITPVDTYKKMMRSIKYALLFLLVPFVSIFICELFSKVHVHPVQYCLVGLADIMFYLLLLSISEHLSFNSSYFISAVCVSATTLLYSAAVFGNIRWGALLSGIQMISYVFLYGTLQAEDYALLIGSIGLFMVIVLLMFITRKIDWYEIKTAE
jgi:inner membrane protein